MGTLTAASSVLPSDFKPSLSLSDHRGSLLHCTKIPKKRNRAMVPVSFFFFYFLFLFIKKIHKIVSWGFFFGVCVGYFGQEWLKWICGFVWLGCKAIWASHIWSIKAEGSVFRSGWEEAPREASKNLHPYSQWYHLKTHSGSFTDNRQLSGLCPYLCVVSVFLEAQVKNLTEEIKQGIVVYVISYWCR